MPLAPDIAAKLKRNSDGLFTAVAQERDTGKVLMVAWMDDAALERTLADTLSLAGHPAHTLLAAAGLPPEALDPQGLMNPGCVLQVLDRA